MSFNIDMMDMATDDLVFSEPRKRQAVTPVETPIAGDIQLTSTGNMSKPQDTQSWWHMGTTPKKHTEPTQFDWAIKPKKAQGGLDFGLNLSGTTMLFTGRQRVFY
tara:strand:+ start:650 stop:964 length:315 start_codon:yes stop_codon:yes gene_type:complete